MKMKMNADRKQNIHNNCIRHHKRSNKNLEKKMIATNKGMIAVE